MSSLYITTLTLEYVFALVTVDGTTPDDSLDVTIALPAEGETPDTWINADWDAGRARILVGTGGDIVLAAGRYDMWVKVTSSPEIPARKAGVVVVK